MPRGYMSKQRARERRRQDRAETQRLKKAQAAIAEEEEATSSSSPVCRDDPLSYVVAGTVQTTPSVPNTTKANAGISCKISDVHARNHVKESKNFSQASTSSECSGHDFLTHKTNMLVQFLLYKYKMNEPIRKAEMLKVVHTRYRNHFPDIFQKASEYMDQAFGLELEEVKPNSYSYTLVSKRDTMNSCGAQEPKLK